MTDITELAQSLKAAADSVIKNYDCEWFETGSQICTVHKSKVNLISLANPANILALVEALEKAQRANGYLREQSAEWERKAISNFEDCAEMSARVEELESQRKLAFTASNRWADKFREAEKRIAELESRHVNVKLPPAVSAGGQGYQEQAERKLTAEGIKWEAE